MKVKQLIKLLQKEDPDRIVVVASDAEGNNYSPLSDITTGAYDPETTYSGVYGLEKLTKAGIKLGYSEEDVIKGKKALCLHPIN